MWNKLRALLTSDSGKQVFRYGSVTIASYAILLAGTYALVEWLHADPTLSYGLTLTFVYVLVYISSSLFVFREKISQDRAIRFALAIFFMWILNTLVFHILETYFNIYYLLAVLINILVFGPLRFITQKFWVFKKKSD